jgi:PPOX class probable F420-dependent enzyme
MLDDPAARELLERPGLLGVVCTRRADGSPRATPVWFRFDGSAIRIWTDEERGWVRSLEAEDRISFSVHENERPWRSVVIRGRASVDPDATQTIREIRSITARYLGAGEIDGYIEGWPRTRSIVTIEPTGAFVAQAFEDPVAHRRRG